MLIVHGTKHVRRQLGYIADFCFLCRGVRPFRLVRLGLASHVYYITTSAGRLLAFERVCQECGVTLNGRVEHYREAHSRNLALPDLISRTHPELGSRRAERLRLEHRIARGEELAPEVREALLWEPVQLVAPLVEARGSGNFDGHSGLGCAATIAVPLLIMLLAPSSGPAQDAALMTALPLGAIGTVYTLIQLYLGPRRFRNAKVVPWLARALAPLKPTPQELGAIAQEAKVDPARLQQALAQAPPTAGPAVAPPSEQRLSTEELRCLALEVPFFALSQHVEEKAAEGTQFDGPSGLGCALTVLFSLGFMTWAATAAPANSEKAIGWGLLLIGLGTIYTIIQLALVPGRHLRRVVLPPLAGALAALRARPDEIRRTLRKLKAFQMEIGKLKPHVLEAAVAAQPAPAGPPADYVQVADMLKPSALEAIRTQIVAGGNLSQTEDALQQAELMLENGEPLEACQLVYACMPALMLAPAAHRLLAEASAAMGDTARREAEERLVKTCLDWLRQSGDGSAERPYQALFDADAVEVIRSLGRRETSSIVISGQPVTWICEDQSRHCFLRGY